MAARGGSEPAAQADAPICSRCGCPVPRKCQHQPTPIPAAVPPTMSVLPPATTIVCAAVVSSVAAMAAISWGVSLPARSAAVMIWGRRDANGGVGEQ